MVPGVRIHDSITLGEDTNHPGRVLGCHRAAGPIRHTGLNKGTIFVFRMSNLSHICRFLMASVYVFSS